VQLVDVRKNLVVKLKEPKMLAKVVRRDDRDQQVLVMRKDGMYIWVHISVVEEASEEEQHSFNN
jgi:hypothetical protein